MGLIDGQVKPHILVNIIMNNKWDPIYSVMRSQKKSYNLKCKCVDEDFIIGYKPNKSSHPFALKVGKKIKDTCDKIEFLLTSNGLLIGYDEKYLSYNHNN